MKQRVARVKKEYVPQFSALEMFAAGIIAYYVNNKIYVKSFYSDYYHTGSQISEPDNKFEYLLQHQPNEIYNGVYTVNAIVYNGVYTTLVDANKKTAEPLEYSVYVVSNGEIAKYILNNRQDLIPEFLPLAEEILNEFEDKMYFDILNGTPNKILADAFDSIKNNKHSVGKCAYAAFVILNARDSDSILDTVVTDTIGTVGQKVSFQNPYIMSVKFVDKFASFVYTGVINGCLVYWWATKKDENLKIGINYGTITMFVKQDKCTIRVDGKTFVGAQGRRAKFIPST